MTRRHNWISMNILLFLVTWLGYKLHGNLCNTAVIEATIAKWDPVPMTTSYEKQD